MSNTATKGEVGKKGRKAGATSKRGGRSANPKASKPAGGSKKGNAGGRLRPGQLDGLVLGYMKKHKGELPVTATKVARGIKRSSGAVGNCLGRLEAAEKVRLTDKKPRRYDLADSTK
jgi:hypothetical protein